MKPVWDQISRRRANVVAHPFFVWLNSDATSLERRFVFAPVMIDFIMGFADMNKWFLNYSEPQTDQEKAINEHTREDRTHSRLFYENWYTIQLGDPAKWRPGKMLWWLFHSSDSVMVRRFGMDILDLSVNYPDAPLRFSMMEAIEVCGDVFFGNTAPLAELLSEREGVDHRYFGHYHRERETGHLHTDETVFEGNKLTAEQMEQCAYVVDRVFDRFLNVLDQVLAYAQRAADDDLALARELEEEYRMTLTPPGECVDRQPPVMPIAAVSASQWPALRMLQDRLDRLRRHPFLTWLGQDRTHPREKLQCFIAIWGIDIVGYKDFNELVLRYPTPRSPGELAINQWTEDLAKHGALYMQDWQALQMDDLLSWNAGETIGFYFLSEQTEIHRRNMAKVKQYAFRYQHPVLRWWLMKALETSGRPLFECTTPLAEAVEQEDGVVLNYWTNRHDRADPHRRAGLDESVFASQDISQDECELVCRMINVVFDNIEQQFSLSHDAAIDRLFVRAPDTLPPPARISGVVALNTARALEKERRSG